MAIKGVFHCIPYRDGPLHCHVLDGYVTCGHSNTGVGFGFILLPGTVLTLAYNLSNIVRKLIILSAPLDVFKEEFFGSHVVLLYFYCAAAYERSQSTFQSLY